jgi:hypothetical protein
LEIKNLNSEEESVDSDQSSQQDKRSQARRRGETAPGRRKDEGHKKIEMPGNAEDHADRDSEDSLGHEDTADSGAFVDPDGHPSVSITGKWALFYAVMACVTIVSLYFLYDYLGNEVGGEGRGGERKRKGG